MPTSSKLFRSFEYAVAWGALVAVVTNYIEYRNTNTLIIASLAGAATGYVFYVMWLLGGVLWRWFRKRKK